jgi:hypothetical protein
MHTRIDFHVIMNTLKCFPYEGITSWYMEIFTNLDTKMQQLSRWRQHELSISVLHNLNVYLLVLFQDYKLKDSTLQKLKYILNPKRELMSRFCDFIKQVLNRENVGQRLPNVPTAIFLLYFLICFNFLYCICFTHTGVLLKIIKQRWFTGTCSRPLNLPHYFFSLSMYCPLKTWFLSGEIYWQ